MQAQIQRRIQHRMQRPMLRRMLRMQAQMQRCMQCLHLDWIGLLPHRVPEIRAGITHTLAQPATIPTPVRTWPLASRDRGPDVSIADVPYSRGNVCTCCPAQ